MTQVIKRRYYLAVLAIVCVIVLQFIRYNPKITPNNLFVSYALLLFWSLFIFTYIVMQRQKLLRNILMAILAMAGFSFMLVPIYNVFCDITGLNGKLDLSTLAATPQGIDVSRTVTVEFVVNHNRNMPWIFKPKHTTLKVHPGEVAHTAYYAKNTSKRTMIGQAIPSIAPSKVSKYFKKIQCFCFNSQKLGPSESAYLDLQFYLAPEFPQDIHRLTLSYTIFDVSQDNSKGDVT